MPPKKDLCRNFQSGSCRYGDRCKFLHTTQQQQKSNNVFGFGSQTGTSFGQTNTQQQNPNPFGFGVQNSGPANGFAGFKPGDNKWVRPGQPANQSQTAQSQSGAHECKDPAVCKRLITEDFQKERPLWKLSCYGHNKDLPCDVSGDISFEEMRAEAYNDAKRGLSIQAIVEREKNLEKSKLMEYENLIRDPYTKQHAQAALSNQSPFTAFGSPTPQSIAPSPFTNFGPQQGSSPNATFSSPTPQNPAPLPFSGFNPQQGQTPNLTFGVRPSTPPNNGFAAFQGSGPFGTVSGPSGPFGTQLPAQASGNSFTPNTTIFGNGGMNSQGNQVPVQASGNAFAPNVTPFNNNGMVNQSSNFPPTLPITPQQFPSTVEQSHVAHNDVLPADASIWLKAEWKAGEIPEQPPPAEYVR